jgi:hypothetical protein
MNGHHLSQAPGGLALHPVEKSADLKDQVGARVFRQRLEHRDAEADSLVGDSGFGYSTLVVWRFDKSMLPKKECQLVRRTCQFRAM